MSGRVRRRLLRLLRVAQQQHLARAVKEWLSAPPNWVAPGDDRCVKDPQNDLAEEEAGHVPNVRRGREDPARPWLSSLSVCGTPCSRILPAVE